MEDKKNDRWEQEIGEKQNLRDLLSTCVSLELVQQINPATRAMLWVAVFNARSWTEISTAMFSFLLSFFFLLPSLLSREMAMREPLLQCSKTNHENLLSVCDREPLPCFSFSLCYLSGWLSLWSDRKTNEHSCWITRLEENNTCPYILRTCRL